MENVKLVPLSDGTDAPQLFSVAFRCATAEQTKEQIVQFFDAGVRHFEIAELFGNGHIIVEALGELCERSQIYISYKIWPKSRTAEDIAASVQGQLKEIGLNYVDLLMVHAPIDVENKALQYKALEDLKDLEVTRSLGIVNISAVLLQDLLKNCRITPVVFEMEVSPFSQCGDMVEFCCDSSIAVLNQEPLGKGIRNGHVRFASLANELGISPSLLMLRWSYSKGLCIGLPANSAPISDIINNSEAGLDDIFVTLSPDVMENIEATFDEGLASAWVPTEPAGDEEEEEGNGQ
jgi:diketogulonate reductase-like aldo/keto reductase